MKAKYSDIYGGMVIECHSGQSDAITSPCGKFKLLPCDDCLELQWRSINSVSFVCGSCGLKYRENVGSDSSNDGEAVATMTTGFYGKGEY